MKKLCNVHGVYTTGRCMKCKKNINKTYDKIFRDSSSVKFYASKEWRKIRVIQLERSPLCVLCGQPAKLVDHIKEIKDGGAKLRLDNLQSMCIPCHNLKTAEVQASRGGGGKSLQTKHELTDPPAQISKIPGEGG